MLLNPSPVKTVRLRPLDGLRGIAVMLVVIGHAIEASHLRVPPPFAALGSGGLGVTMFFVLSGFLITSILTSEQRKSGRISLRAFYARRAFRILPAFYAFLIVLALLSALGTFVKVDVVQLLASGLFVWNYAPIDGVWWLGHTWSLAVEEQFYLLWPLVLIFLPPKAVVRVAIVVVAISPVLRLAQYVLFPESRGQIGIMFHTRADALMMGCLLAVLVNSPRWRSIAPALAKWWPAYVAVLLISPIGTRLFAGGYQLTVGWAVEQLAIAGLIATVVLLPQGVLGRALAWRPLVLVGLVSYGLYLWQQLFLSDLWPEWWSPLFGVPSAIGVAVLSYWLIEKPFLRLKKRFERGVVDVQPGI